MKRISRRLMLGGAAGALALPHLDSMQAARAADGPPKRLVLFYNPNGTVPSNWFPALGSGETDFELGSILQPLAHYKERMLLARGIDSTVAEDPTNNGGPHQRGIGSLFTGQKLLTGEFKDGCGKTAGFSAGISIDQVVAEHLGGDTPFRSLELGVRANSNDVQGRIVYSGSGAPLPPTNSPLDLYQRLFGRVAPLDPNSPDSRRQSIVDTVSEQFRELNTQVGAHDRQKLERHLALVEDMERRLGLGHTGAQCEPDAAPLDLLVDSETTMPDISRTQLDLLATALSCDLTRVASVQYSTGFNRIRYPWLDSYGEGHSLSHSGESNTEAWTAFSGRAAWHAGEIAYFLDLLAAMPEGEGSVLDNTVVVWSSEVSQGNSHSLRSLPYLIVGDGQGSIATGRYVEYSGASNCDFLHAILAAFGIDVATFGHPDHASGPLSGILA